MRQGLLKRAGKGSTPLFLAVLALLVTSASALAVTGRLTQLPGTAGCVSESGNDGACADGKGLSRAISVAVSPDGKNVYVASAEYYGAVAVFRRNATTGALTQLAGTAGCVSQDGSGGACADGKALGGPNSLAVSPDGKNVYVASEYSDAVAIFTRDTTTGALAQSVGTAAGCISETGRDGADAYSYCINGKALVDPESIAVSADGKNVYVTSPRAGSVAAFWRNSSGALAQLAGTAGCVSTDGSGGTCVDGRTLAFAWSIAVSADGKNVYVTSPSHKAVAILTRSTTNGALTQAAGAGGCIRETGADPSGQGICTDGKALDTPWQVTASPDGRSVYVTSKAPGKDAVAVLRRNTTSGALAQLPGTAGCISQYGLDGKCAVGKALIHPWALAVSPDSKSLYVTSLGNHGIAFLMRDTTSGALTQLKSPAGCITEKGSGGNCLDGKALEYPIAVAVSADGKSVYSASLFENAVAVFARETPP